MRGLTTILLLLLCADPVAAEGRGGATDEVVVLTPDPSSEQPLRLRLSGIRGSSPAGITALRQEVDIEAREVRIYATVTIGLFSVPWAFSHDIEVGPLPSEDFAILYFGRNVDGGLVTPPAGHDLWDVTAAIVDPAPTTAAAIACSRAGLPGASVLFPYFETDLDGAAGKVTLLSLHNNALDPALARLTVWSDGAVPVLGFDVFLEGHGSQSINLKDVLVAGRLPQTRPTEGFSNHCPEVLNPLPLDAAARARLVARLTGRPDPQDGLCYSVERDDTSIATGYITADVVKDCAPELDSPYAAGYLSADGSGLASDRNVLSGELLSVNPDEDSAQGLTALNLQAVPGLTGPRFYDLPQSNRRPPASRYRGRFLEAAQPDLETDLVIWLQEARLGSDTEPELGMPNGCNEPVVDLESIATFLYLDSAEVEDLPFTPPAYTGAYRPVEVFSTLALLDPPRGSANFELHAGHHGPALPIQAPFLPTPSWTGTVLQADGRFSLALDATPVDGCPQ